MNSESMGKQIKAYRAKSGLNLEKCAEKIGISTRYLADIERGDKVPKLETFIRIINVLNASADEVLQDSLVVGYKTKSNDVIRKLDALDTVQRKQALDIFENVIATFTAK